MRRRLPLIAAGLLLGSAGAVAAPAGGPLVVELFTSQGCNSCPPADALLGELARRPDVLALALHVTYWNDLGWKDPYSQSQFDQRQRDHVRQLKLGSSYTPQMVVNGSADVVGSHRDALERALGKARRPAAIVLTDAAGTLQIALPALDARCDCDLVLFGVRSSASTAVGRGENAGKTLQEYRLVRAMQSLGRWKGEARMLQVKPTGMPADVGAWAVIAEERGTGRVVASGQ
jgi:hypothetical protein